LLGVDRNVVARALSQHLFSFFYLSCREAFGRQGHAGTDYVEAALNRSCSLQQVPSSISQDLPDLQQEFQQQQQHATSQQQQQQQLGSSQQRLQQLDSQQQQQQQGMGMSPSLPPGFGSGGFMPPGFQIGMGNGMTSMQRTPAGFGGKDQQLQPDMSSKWQLAAVLVVVLFLWLGLYACGCAMCLSKMTCEQ
jgi:hypothetical protein